MPLDLALAASLGEFVRSRNALRSAVRAAEGTKSGTRYVNLGHTRREHDRLLRSLAAWVEAQARAHLSLPTTPMFDTDIDA